MRELSVLLVWAMNLFLFGLAIYLYYFVRTSANVSFLGVGGLIMILFITMPYTDYIMGQIHDEKMQQ